MSKSEQEKRVSINARIRQDLLDILLNVRNDTKLSLGELLDLSIIELIGKLEKELTYENIDLKEYANLVKLEKLRKLELKKRVEVKSKHLFIDRVKKDVFLYLTKGKSNKKIFELLNTYQRQARFYEDKTALKEVTKFIDQAKKDEFAEFKSEINERINKKYYNVIGFDNKKKNGQHKKEKETMV